MGKAWRLAIDSNQKSHLVTEGIFQWSRNPIFFGMRAWYLGFFLVMPTALSLVLWVVGDFVIQLQVQLEEQHLIKIFGDRYQTYQSKVRRWI